MSLPGKWQQAKIQDIFENLFQEYKERETQPLPRFRQKKRRVHSMGCDIPADSHKASTSLPILHDFSPNQSLPARAFSHQGSFSSGVFSLDSDLELFSKEGNVTKTNVTSASKLQFEETCSNDETLFLRLSGSNLQRLKSSSIAGENKEDKVVKKNFPRCPQSKQSSAPKRTSRITSNRAPKRTSTGSPSTASKRQKVDAVDVFDNNDSDDDNLSEAGSGYADRHCDSESMRIDLAAGESRVGDIVTNRLIDAKSSTQDGASTGNGDGEPAGTYERSVVTGTGVLTDKDILFMMHKPRVKKKKRKKTTSQKQKIDVDELWLKGQHRWSVTKRKSSEENRPKLFLKRNLGKTCLKRYVSMMKEKARRKRSISKERRKSSAQCATNQSTKSKQSGRNRASSKSTQDKTRRISGTSDSSWTKEEPKRSIRTSKRSASMSDAFALSSFSCTSQDEAPAQQAPGKYRRAVKNKMYVSSSSRSRKSYPPASSAALVEKINTNISSKKSVASIKKAGSLKTSSMSGAYTHHSITGTHTKHSRSKLDSKVLSEIDMDSYSNGGISDDDSHINFVTITPKKSRKLSRHKRKSLPTVMDVPLQGRVQRPGNRWRDVLSSDGPVSSEDIDLEDVAPIYSPLFGESRHCGGVWNSIVEESS